MQIGVAIVAYRAGDELVSCLEALASAGEHLRDADLRVVVLDNCSGDGTAARASAHAPWASVVEASRNDGFAAGANAALARLPEADVVVLLNPDVRVREDFLATLAELRWPPDLAARGPQVLGADGSVEQSARGFPGARTAMLGRSSWLARRRPESALLRRELRADPSAGAHDVDWVSGACLIVPAEMLRRVGPLDEGYFMYWEDADWCRRAHTLGLRIRYEPSLVVAHAQGASSRERPLATTIAFHRSALRYWRLHAARSRASVALAGAALTARCALKLLVLGLRRRPRPSRRARAAGGRAGRA
jgi:GT2 family glycosyltransferase